MKIKELRELDVWVAENVMGFTIIKTPSLATEIYVNSEVFERLMMPPQPLKCYTINPTYAMEVLKKCAEKMKRESDGFYDLVCIRPKTTEDGWTVFKQSQENWGHLYEEADTIELAICLFAKKLFSSNEHKP